MISNKEAALKFFTKRNENEPVNKVELQSCIEILQKVAADEGLPEVAIDDIVEYLISTKLNAQSYIGLFDCLIPETKISNQSLENILLWFFTEVGNNRISNAVSKKCLQWLSGITHYELADISIIESYYHSFIFFLSKPHLERLLCRLLCQISKPEDATRWVVLQILHIPGSGNLKPHKNALLCLLKSYNGNVIPEKIPLTIFHYETTPLDEFLEKAHERKSDKNQNIENTVNSNIQWNTFSNFDNKTTRLPRLVPSIDSLNYDLEKHGGRNLRSLYEYKTMTSLGVHPFDFKYPAEVLSLLANTAGHHILTFSDFVIKSRFYHRLFHTLCEVFILQSRSYSEKECVFFLNALKELQEYAQQSIPVVTEFLVYYLPIWDGEEYQKEILGLLQWIEIREEDDLETYVFAPLRQIFISSGTHCKTLIIETMGKLVRNLLIMDKTEQNFFRMNYQDVNLVKSIETIHNFAKELISLGLIWNNEKSTRNILNSSIDFYEMTLAVEQAGDLPLIMVMPPALVYTCLFSNSRVCLARMCSLLVRLQEISVERLYFLGVFQDFAAEVQKLNIYMLDYYRCLWSKLDLCEQEDSFIFQTTVFRDKMWKLRERYGEVIDRVFGIDYNSSFWDPKTKGLREVVMCQLSEDYPAVVRLKQVAEERLLRVN